VRLFSLVGALAVVAAAAVAGSAACGGLPRVNPDASSMVDGGAPDHPMPQPRHDAGRDAGAVDATVGAPFLKSLRVTAKTDAGIVLEPTFSPDIHDYYVRCAAGTNALKISMEASQGAESRLLQPTPSATQPAQTLDVTVLENQAVVAAAVNRVATAEYWIRCLPHDMVQWTWTAHTEAGAPPTGYYLVGNFYSIVGVGGYAFMFDSNGVPVWYARAPDGGNAVDVENLTPGAIYFFPNGAQASHNYSWEIRELAPPATLFVVPDGWRPSVHEFRVLENGDYMILAAPFDRGVDFDGLTLHLPDGGTAPLHTADMLDCTVVEFAPDGRVVWTWSASKHFAPSALTYIEPAMGQAPLADGGVVLGGFHCNSIDVDPATGNLLISARNMDSVFYVDRATGNVLWKMGGSAASLDDSMYVTVADPFHRQHDARFQPGWTETCTGGKGKISLFDDESYVDGAVARALVYDVNVGAPGGRPFEAGCASAGGAEAGVGAATLSWEYKGAATSVLTGSFRLSADGSRVIGWGFGGTPDLAFTEVDDAGQDLLDFYFARSAATYRAIKVPLTAFDLNVLRKTAGSP
jgi:hypothetical protein